MPWDEAWWVSRLLFLIPLVLSLTVHEWAHAWSAHRLGDDTARLQGRLTLDPLAHIDPVGTLLLPLLGIPFGWAKPVPVEPLRFRRGVHMRIGLLLVAAAGPLSNLCIALACVIGFAAAVASGAGRDLRALVEGAVLLNLVLAAFNLLPIPPLDGSRVADSLMPDRWRRGWDSFVALGPVLLVAAIAGPFLLGLNPFGWAIDGTRAVLDSVAAGR